MAFKPRFVDPWFRAAEPHGGPVKTPVASLTPLVIQYLGWGSLISVSKFLGATKAALLGLAL